MFIRRGICFFLAVLVVFILPAEVGGEEITQSISGDVDLRAYYDNIRGNEELSFKEDGFNYLTDLYFYYDRTLGEDNDVVLDGLLYLRATDDGQYQTSDDRVRVENIHLTAERNGSWHLTGGYFSERYSALTMNMSQLGVKGNYQLGEDIKWSSFAGRDRRASGDQPRRMSGGTQLAWQESENASWNINYVRTRDHASSVDEPATVQSNEILSLVGEREHGDGMVRMSGEVARGEITTDGTEFDNQLAYRGDLRLRPREDLRFNYRFDRADENFESLTASFRENRILHRGRVEYDPQEWGMENWSYHFVGQRDIDEATRSDTRDRRVIRGGINYRGGYDRWLRDLTLEKRRRWREDKTTDEDERVQEIEAMFDLGVAELLLGTTFEDQRKADDRTREHSSVLYWDRTFFGVPVDFETGFDYRKTRTSDRQYDRRNIFEQRLVLGRGGEQIFLDYRYDYDRRGTTGDLVQEQFEASFERQLLPEYNGVLSLSFEWFDNRDKEDSSRNYSEYTYELGFRGQF